MNERGEPETPSDAETPPGTDVPGERAGGDYAPSVAQRLAFFQRAGGVATPFVTAIFAFFVGGLVVLVTTGKNPLRTYQAIFEGSGLSWFLEVGGYSIGLPFSDARVWFPWNTNDIESLAASNLQQTLLTTAPLILTGLAVAFAFRCGLFNIGGQGQYAVGTIIAVWVGSSFASLATVPHALLAMVLAALGGAVYAGIAGLLKATVGAHEVITTIMLNFLALNIVSALIHGPLIEPTRSYPETGMLPAGAMLGFAERVAQRAGTGVAAAAINWARKFLVERWPSGLRQRS